MILYCMNTRGATRAGPDRPIRRRPARPAGRPAGVEGTPAGDRGEAQAFFFGPPVVLIFTTEVGLAATWTSTMLRVTWENGFLTVTSNA